MATNLELKIKLNSFGEIIENIKNNKILHIKTLLQKDTYYKIHDGLLKLRKQNDNFELIKYKRNEKNGERWSNYFVLNVSGENAENYFDDLFEIETVVEKTRELYIYENTRIHLDEVKSLGKFLELETVVDKLSKEESIKEFNEVVKILHLNISDQIRKSYRDLLLKKQYFVET